MRSTKLLSVPSPETCTDKKAKITGTGGAGKASSWVFWIVTLCEVRVEACSEDVRRETLHAGNPGSTSRRDRKCSRDEYVGYRGLNPDYVHNVIDHAEAYVRGDVHTNGLENFWSCLKRGLKGTYVSVEPFHLFRYLDEQAFRFNNRKGTDAARFVGVASFRAWPSPDLCGAYRKDHSCPQTRAPASGAACEARAGVSQRSAANLKDIKIELRTRLGSDVAGEFIVC